ncbi:MULTISPECIES: hypothetical protein [unclassified Paenibacillus]|uniref:hypothetical protein n=1 Tax=unclassified Paenibacillus TaxID=185978 RepID=UPI0009CD782E|nr:MULTISPECIES: hypothetical protein [unclassified Paenibacillus]SLJ94566.1 hypothetical protein SAMN06272722_1025 [Paenibacillus sp. RU5A]SOC67508.1 hypothetical protein SAMN05880581_102993 [Paenibacillus sp. RU26A]SOC68924.1 hypothetical protein SAMN05880586_1025 [Paenibacillus sp. RU5M]
MTAARLQERIDMKRRLDKLLRMRLADPSAASWFDGQIEELEAGLRQKEGQA